MRRIVSCTAAGVLMAWRTAMAGAPYAYVSNYYENTVTVVHTANNLGTVAATIHLPQPAGDAADAWGLGGPADGTRIYVAQVFHGGGGQVSVIDGSSWRVISTFAPDAACAGPLGVAVKADGSRLFVDCGFWVKEFDSNLAPIDLKNPVGGFNTGYALVPPLLWFANQGGTGVVFLHVDPFDNPFPVNLGCGTTGVAADPTDPSHAFAVCNRAGQTIFELSGNVVFHTYQGSSPNGVAFGPGGVTAWVADSGDNTVKRIHNGSLTSISPGFASSSPVAVATDPQTSNAYALGVDANGETLLAILSKDGSVLKTALTGADVIPPTSNAIFIPATSPCPCGVCS